MSNKSLFEMEEISKAYRTEAEEQARLMRLARMATAASGNEEDKGNVSARFNLFRWLAGLWMW